MIDGINGATGPHGPRPHMQSITDEQKEKLDSVLSDYDPEALSDTDAVSIVTQISELGIGAGAGLADVLHNAGYDASGLAAQAGISGGTGGPEGGGGPRGPGGAGESGRNAVDDAVVSLIDDVISGMSDSDAEVSFSQALAARLAEEGYDAADPLVDFYA